jgi:GDPmannose 4,6-dehydratase
MGARRALITGITGQDGSFLAELLLEKGYSVTGTIRGQAGDPLGCSEHLRGEVSLVAADLERPQSLRAAVAELQPDELYHLAAPSFVPYSWQHPTETLASIAGSTAALLEAVREHSNGTRTFVAGSGAMFGDAHESPQRETTPSRPQTPYATAKLAAHHLVGQLRAHDDLFACSGILYNHESERRPERFVTRKITRAAAAIKLGLVEDVVLGDLDAVRDWSYAGDIMHGAWLTLQQDAPEDYILASGTPHTVSELAETAFSYVGLHAPHHIRVDGELVRSSEHTIQLGDPSRARARLGWKPTIGFQQLVQRMVDHDLRALELTARRAPKAGEDI